MDLYNLRNFQDETKVVSSSIAIDRPAVESSGRKKPPHRPPRVPSSMLKKRNLRIIRDTKYPYQGPGRETEM